jgi:hypothetical protein
MVIGSKTLEERSLSPNPMMKVSLRFRRDRLSQTVE